MSEERDFYAASAAIFAVSRCVGVAPGRVGRRSAGPAAVRLSRAACAYSLSILAALVSLSLLGLLSDLASYGAGSRHAVRMKTGTSVVVTFCDHVSVMLTAAVAILFAAVRFDDIRDLVQRMYDIDVFFQSRMTPSVNLQRWQFARRQRLLLLVACQGYLVLMALYDAWVWASKAGRLPYIYLPIYGLYLVVGGLEMQFVHIVWHLQQHFRLLNHLMAGFSDGRGPALWLPPSHLPLPPHSSTKRRSPTVATVLRRALSAAQRALILRRPIVSPRYPATVRPLGLKTHRDQLKGAVKCDKIRAYSSNDSHTPNQHLLTLHSLCEVHAELYDAVDAVNSAYGFQILVHTLSIFLHCIISPYFFLLNLLYPMTYGQTDPAFLSLQFMWILIHVSKLFLLVQPCSATCNEAKKTGSIVVKLLNAELQLPMKRQLEVFAIQLLHRKVEFSAFGFCNLDFPLIASIAGSVTTYLVILIQFQNSDTVSAPNNPSN